MIKKLAKYIKDCKKDAILTPIFVILEVVMEVVIPYLMAKIIDVGIQNSDVKYIIEIGAFLILFPVIYCLYLTSTFDLQLITQYSCRNQYSPM